ncbi:arylsulfatase [Pelagicoccus mobilis]|uniref:Arylsulfatase n=1 Tax=Pelagicoccus mobilis TaxID=415221 RepID=A0A934RZS4_9BACT|nr:arylsulfatase [Pelagicoccus mobilis]MBK1876483.1 arylsulfatase [Pelagicoccus mobilis]
MRPIPVLFATILCFASFSAAAKELSHPNVVLIMTDDQGYGDFGVLGNEIINTPHLDQLARESASMTDFYVSPVCSPTRANLMTGRYNYRTRVVDTYKGRSMMDPEEYTLAEALSDSGYATGIFGKWHLGDNYPLRATDQGFHESYLHLGGGLAQPSEPIENERRYTNPILFHNNKKIETRGYCTDLYFEAASEFIDKAIDDEQPFFAYIATNAPHGPFHDVPEALYQKYKSMDLSSIMLGDYEYEDNVARVFAMIENVDENIGRLVDQLERRGVTRDTIVIYLNDNGPNSVRYVGPFRGRKGEIYEGGIRSPLWMKWPARLKAGAESDRVSAHYDIMPTILEAANAKLPAGVHLDGRSLLPLLEGKSPNWPERDIFIQAHRGDEPTLEHNMMMRSQRWKLLRASGFHNEKPDVEVPFELYDILADPSESNNLFQQRKDVANAMLERYHNWFEDVSNTRPDNYAPPRMRIGDRNNKQLILTWQNRRVTPTSFEWLLQADRKGSYDLEIQWVSPVSTSNLEITIAEKPHSVSFNPETESYLIKGVGLEKGAFSLQMSLPQGYKKQDLPYYLILRKS